MLTHADMAASAALWRAFDSVHTIMVWYRYVGLPLRSDYLMGVPLVFSGRVAQTGQGQVADAIADGLFDAAERGKRAEKQQRDAGLQHVHHGPGRGVHRRMGRHLVRFF